MHTALHFILTLAFTFVNMLGFNSILQAQDQGAGEIRRLETMYQGHEVENEDSIIELLADRFERLITTADAGATILADLQADQDFGIQIWTASADRLTAYSFRYDNFGFFNFITERLATGPHVVFADRAALFGWRQFASLGKDRFLVVGRSDDLSFSTNYAQVYQLLGNGTLQVQNAFCGKNQLQYTVWTHIDENTENDKYIAYDPVKREISLMEILPNGQSRSLQSARYRRGTFKILSFDERIAVEIDN